MSIDAVRFSRIRPPLLSHNDGPNGKHPSFSETAEERCGVSRKTTNAAAAVIRRQRTLDRRERDPWGSVRDAEIASPMPFELIHRPTRTVPATETADASQVEPIRNFPHRPAGLTSPRRLRLHVVKRMKPSAFQFVQKSKRGDGVI